MAKLILMRHGQSEWNKKNLFTGWIDIPLSQEGIDESFVGGKKIADLPIDLIYTSTLMRAIMTAMLVMLVHKSGKIPAISHIGEGKLEKWAYCDREAEKTLIPVVRAWELNERMYGDLQGLNKQKTREKYGDKQVKIWRRSFATPPPGGESLKMTAARAIPYFEAEIMPKLKKGKNILIAAHGNSLRAIMMDLDRLSEEEVVNLELPTGEPVIYDFEKSSYTKVTV